MKTQKFITLAICLLLATTLFARSNNSVSYAAVKKDFHKNISDAFSKELKKTENYLYENNIYNINDKVHIEFYIDSENKPIIQKICCKKFETEQFIKYVFKNNSIKCASSMKGKKYSIDLCLRYSTL